MNLAGLQERWHGAPKYVWLGGGSVLLAGTVLIWRRRRAAALAGSTTATLTGSGGSDYSAPLPGMGGIGGGGGLSLFRPPGSDTPSSPSSDSGSPVISPVFDVTPATDYSQPAEAPPAPVVAAGPVSSGPPANQYSVGQQVTPTERIVSAIFSPVYGWLNETSLGGIYTGGGGTKGIESLDYGGSYLGYAGQTANPTGEIATHGNFGTDGLQLLPGGGYQETNVLGESYQFGS